VGSRQEDWQSFPSTTSAMASTQIRRAALCHAKNARNGKERRSLGSGDGRNTPTKNANRNEGKVDVGSARKASGGMLEKTRASSSRADFDWNEMDSTPRLDLKRPLSRASVIGWTTTGQPPSARRKRPLPRDARTPADPGSAATSGELAPRFNYGCSRARFAAEPSIGK